jgi:hypothetical protein
MGELSMMSSASVLYSKEVNVTDPLVEEVPLKTKPEESKMIITYTIFGFKLQNMYGGFVLGAVGVVPQGVWKPLLLGGGGALVVLAL